MRTAGRGRTNTTWYALTAAIVLIGVALVVFLRPTSVSPGVELGQHWHAALGVYACNRWDGDANWPTPIDQTTKEPVGADTGIYAGLHSHNDGLIHMEPQTSDVTGTNGTIGNYFKLAGFELSSSRIKFVTATLKNGDKCGRTRGALQWLANGKKRTGDPADYVVHDQDWIVIAFLPDTKKITSLGKPPSFQNLAKEGAAKP